MPALYCCKKTLTQISLYLSNSTKLDLLHYQHCATALELVTRMNFSDGDTRGSPESQSTFYPEPSGSPASGCPSDLQQHSPSHFPPNASPRPSRSCKSSTATTTSLRSSPSSSSLIDAPRHSNPNISNSEVKLRVRKRIINDTHPARYFDNRRSISLENLTAEIAPEKEGNLISKSLKRIKNTKMSRIHARDIFSSNMSSSPNISKSTLLIYGATTDPDQFSLLFKDATTS